METLESDNKKQVLDLVSSLRGKLNDNGQSLKWWHAKHCPANVRYDYFIRQINNLELIRMEVIDAIKKYMEK